MISNYHGPDKEVSYQLPMGEERVDLNPLIGREIELNFIGQINCIATGEEIKKSYNQGYSFKAFKTLAQCDFCIVRPELCHYFKGTCREPEWGEKHCLIPHYIYLSLTSNLKVGITRHTQIPTRWIDQGAVKALPLVKVKDRLTAGLIEKEMSSAYADRTNWRAMLKGEVEDVDLLGFRQQIFEEFGDLLDEYDATEVLDSEETMIRYPIGSVPEKISSLSFDKTPVITSTLTGIKGQYLIFDKGVLNIRKHQGYFVELSS